METIKAFIAHSFDDNDKNLVREFLDYFNTIKKSNIPFIWDHAESAEAKVLSDKVLQKMKNANTFIGICTKKETVLDETNLKKSFFNKNKFVITSNDYKWKTSDWIIQEIGCAFGREMKIILLVENGLRQPGGLQGNLEYIEFERKNPEKVFKKILQIVQNLLPVKDKELGITSDQKEQPIEAKKLAVPDEKKGKPHIEIKNDWGKEEFLNGLIDTIIFGDKEKEKEIINEYNIKFCKDNKEEMEVFEARSLYYRFLVYKDDNLEKIKQLLKKYSNNSELLEMIAHIYDKCEQNEFSSDYYIQAYKNSSIISDKIKYLSYAVINLIKSGKDDYKGYISKMIELDVDGASKELIYTTISQIFKLKKNDYLYMLVLESAVNEFPLNTSFRFDLAYSYGEKNIYDRAFYHYSFLVKHFEKSGTYWNNLGVATSGLNMPHKAIQAYRKSENLGETLAMANIAQKYISAGFFEEAEQICNKAMGNDNYHKNVLFYLNQIVTNKKAENESENRINDDVKQKRNDLLKLSKGLFLIQIKKMNDAYQHPDCVLDVIVNEDKVKFTGKYTRKNVFSSLMKLTNPNMNAESEIEYKIEIEGTIFGHLIEGTYSNNISNIKDEDKIKKTEDIIMLVSSDLRLIEIYKKQNNEKMFELSIKEKQNN